MADLSPLRRRMIEDMTVRNMSPATQRSYVSAVSKFSRYFGKSPDRLDLEDVRTFQVHLVSTEGPILSRCLSLGAGGLALPLVLMLLESSCSFVVGVHEFARRTFTFRWTRSVYPPSR